MEKEAARIIALTLMMLLLLGNIACSGGPQPDSANVSQWQPHKSIPGVLRRDLVGDPSRTGPFKYQLKITAGTRVAVHQHSTDVQVKVLGPRLLLETHGNRWERNRLADTEYSGYFCFPDRL